MLRLTRVEANVDLKDQRAKVLEGRLQESKDVGGFHDNSWQQSVAQEFKVKGTKERLLRSKATT